MDSKKPTKHYRANGINYIFEEEVDGWISIYKYEDGIGRIPIIQACNMQKAEEFAIFREELSVPTQRLC